MEKNTASRPRMTQTKLIFFTALWLLVLYNMTMYAHIIGTYSLDGKNIFYIASTGVVLVAVTTFLFTIFASKYTTKPLLVTVLLVSSLTAYFMDQYNVIIDKDMLRNVFETQTAEVMDLLNFKLFGYFLLLGVVPAYVVYKTKVDYQTPRRALLSKVRTLLLSAIVAIATIAVFGKFYASFFREHKVLRYYSNPTYWIYSLGYYMGEKFITHDHTLKKIGLDAKIEDDTTRKIVFMVVGEAARADHFSLNGYARQTNPKLQSEDILNYEKMYSCGTSTAYSVPCMFSIYTRSEYSHNKALYTENVLDVLKHTGKVAILWRDNNSDSKGVALRVEYQDYKTPKNNPVCDSECRDIGMLEGLEEYIARHKEKNILIVLHQMGNHGPEYYKRYTEAYKKFTPVCKTNDLEKCQKEEIVNAYDNALLYSDNFLASTIELAKRFPQAETAVLYMSDHGESLGENGVYLHGLPYFIAPDAQIHIGSFLWLNERYKNKLDIDKIKIKANAKLSHDYLFHTLLGLFGVKTKVYDKHLDLVH